MSVAPDSGTGSTARHACHCGKSFVRKEHLTRHQATHDKLVHVCNICQRRFSRKDLLRRHSILHEASHTRIVVSCDACRANKTKCSGGTQCSLCARRGINCTFLNDLHQSKRGSKNDGPASVNASVSEDDDNDDNEPTSPRSSRPENPLAGHGLHTEGELLPPTVEFFQNLTIVSSKPVTTSELPYLSPGIEAIYEILDAEKSSLEGTIQESDELHEHVTKYLKTYFKSFHLRWAILHAPTFDIRIASLPLAASVCVIGAWFQNRATETEKFYALRVHGILLQRLLHSLIDPESKFEGEAWPIERFQAVLLTLIFSLYRTDKSALSRATLLRSAFIILLRDLGAFDAELFADHLKTYFSGTYAPYMLSMRERFKRLLVSTYQFDAYFSLAHDMPPMLHRQEVELDLLSSFALWNIYGLDIFVNRQADEPPGRSECQISEMTSCPDSFKSSQLLVEDVQLGLCGLLQTIWVLSQSLPPKTRGKFTNNFQRILLIETLDGWKYELDKIDELTDAKSITNNAAKYLLLAYRGEDDSMAASLERITALVQDGMVLYYYLKMYHYAGLNASGVVGLVNQIEDTRTPIYRISKDGREALVCALQMVKTADLIAPSGTSINPLIRHALTMGVNVIRVLLSCQTCECLAKEGEHSADMNLQRWAEIGGLICIDGTPICICKLDFWTARFEKAIQDQESMVE